MNAKELIGKNAIRVAPTKKGVVKDESYIDTPIFIVNATDSRIVYKYIGKYLKLLGEKEMILNYAFCDDNWIEYDELNLEKIAEEKK